MRNLLLLIFKYNFVIYFLLLEIFCFYLIIQYNHYQRSAFFASSASSVSALQGKVQNLKEYLSLDEKNRVLEAENARLKQKVLALHSDSINTINSFTDSSLQIQYELLSAEVVNNSVNKRMNYITLNAGYDKGIQPDMAVITTEGVVGIVRNVSEHYSLVMPVIHKNSSVSAALKSTEYFGSLVWEGTDPTIARLKEIPKHVKVQTGDTITTTSYSAIFPKDILIGVVKEVIDKKGNNFLEMDIKLAVDFRKLTYVYVIKNKLQYEQLELEASINGN